MLVRGCTLRLTSTLEKKKEEEQVHQFLIGLDDGVYGTVCTNILSMDPMPNLNRVYAMIIQEERHKNMARIKDERNDVVVFDVQTGPKSAAMRAKEKTGSCGHCGRTGHEATDCFQVIGYPEWWGDRPKGNGRGRGGRGGSVNGRGRGGGVRINTTRVPSSDSEGVSNDADSHNFPGLNKEQ